MAELHEQIKSAIEFGTQVPDIPQFISNNLRYVFFDWQKQALQYFLLNENRNKAVNSPTHLMFNMAMGTGKTLLMASTILYYYNKGYRHFLFFVNQNNIIDKTENNFIDNTHTKYLFKDKIVIENKTIQIKKVDTFSDNPQAIEIKFTSIQKLYNDIHLERENQTTLDDLHSKNIVMLADEAHHLNTDTKNNTDTQLEAFTTEITGKTGVKEIEKKGWEHTVIELILNKNGKQGINKNVLLEFTATIPANEKVATKYKDKIIYKFGLKEFLQAGYTKEINLISSSLDKKERVFQALLFQWYRHKIALKNGIANFKPVILFRSKTIDESKSDYEEFLKWTDDISSKDFDFLMNIRDEIKEPEQLTIFEMGKSRTEQVLAFIKKENIHLGDIANWIKQSYQRRSTIITNSKTNTKKTEITDEETEQLLNSLEDRNNHIRAIFTVNRLTEGWDVLNLFDIVRLYDGRDEGKGKNGERKSGSATISEKQLIGRGVRYFPFEFEDKIKNKRKFDKNLDNELRVLEELYFYSSSDHRYISELKSALKEDGYITENRELRTFALKRDFQKSKFYKETKIWYNKQIDNPDRKKKTLDDIRAYFSFEYKIKGLEFTEQEIDLENHDDKQRVNLQENSLKTITLKFKDIEKHIIQKAINIKAKQENSLLQFELLKEELEIESIDDLYNDKLADFDLKIIVNKINNYNDIDNKDKLALVIKFLDNIFAELKEIIVPKVGSKFFSGDFKNFFAEPKTKAISTDDDSEKISKELESKDWYVLDSFNGTSEEKELIEFIKDTMGNLESKYEEIYLLRNEEVYKIFDFEQGRGFQPDFILFLKTKVKKDVSTVKTELYYQIFIEPKGNQFIGDDRTFLSGKEGWKEKFLKEITNRYGLEDVIRVENLNYRLIGLPFFNNDNKANFETEYNKIID